MNIEELREYSLSLDQVTEGMPFGDDVLVMKICDKIFCLILMDESLRINVKCDPDEAIQMRESFSAVLPGFHMNKKYWNTVLIDGTISESLLKNWIKKSYNLVVAGLPKKIREKNGFPDR